MKRIPIDLTELAALMSESFDENRVFLDTDTGEIVLLPSELIDPLLDDEDDELNEDDLPDWEVEMLPVARAVAADDAGRYVGLPEPDPGEDAAIMRSFAASLKDAALRERLLDAVSGPHPFRRFRQIIDTAPEQRDKYLEFKGEEYLRLAREWLNDLGIEPVEPPAG